MWGVASALGATARAPRQGRCCFSFLSFWGVGTSGPVPGRWKMVFSIALIWSVRETIDNLSIEGGFVTRAIRDIYGAYCRGAHDCSPMRVSMSTSVKPISCCALGRQKLCFVAFPILYAISTSLFP